MKIDNSFERYLNNPGDENYRRYQYAVSHLFGSVLDVGCGDGFGAYMMTKNKDIRTIFAIDNDDRCIDKAIKNQNLHNKSEHHIIFSVNNAEKLEYSDGAFDCVHCGQTLEHVADDHQAIKEIYRVTKRRAVFSVPLYGGISEQHKREYTYESFVNLIGLYFTIISVKMFAGKYNRVVIVAEK